MALSTYEKLGNRAPVPCDIGDAHGVAMAFNDGSGKVTPTPFRHPELLDNEVRMRLTHSGLCHTDVFNVTQAWGPFTHYPIVPGHELVGVIDKVGEKVTKFQEGDKVAFGTMRHCCNNCKLCAKGRDNLCPEAMQTYNPHFGGYSTSFQANSDFFFKMPENLPSEAAPLLCAGVTVFNPMVKNIRPGDKVGVVGIGGLGHLALQYANKMGCEVTAFSSSASKETEARQLGANYYVNTSDPDQVTKAIASVDFLINTASSMNITRDSTFVKPGGILSIVGAPSIGEDVGFCLPMLLLKSITLVTSFVGSKNEVNEMLEFSAFQKILPMTNIYPFGDMQAAYDSLAHGTPQPPKYRNVVETASFFNSFTPATN